MPLPDIGVLTADETRTLATECLTNLTYEEKILAVRQGCKNSGELNDLANALLDEADAWSEEE